MRISRIYLPLTPVNLADDTGQTITIENEKAHYIRNVLRLKVGHLIHFFIPNGSEYQAKIAAIEKHKVTLEEISRTTQQPRPSQLKTTLVQAISSSDRMDYSIQKAAELGCKQVIPVLTDFCSQKIAEHKRIKKQSHWQGVAISACEQSGRSDVMQVAEIQTIEQLCKNLPAAIYLEPNANLYLNQLPAPYQQQQTVIIGPEGGFSPAEIDRFKKNEYLGVQLGPRVLRTETVAPVILAALHALYGDFKPPAG